MVKKEYLIYICSSVLMHKCSKSICIVNLCICQLHVFCISSFWFINILYIIANQINFYNEWNVINTMTFMSPSVPINFEIPWVISQFLSHRYSLLFQIIANICDLWLWTVGLKFISHRYLQSFFFDGFDLVTTKIANICDFL